MNILKVIISLLLLSASCIIKAQQQTGELSNLTGPYFGQKPPGKIPEPFGTKIPEIQRELHSIIVFSQDGKEAYWKPQWNGDSAIYVSKLVNNFWSAPKIASFSQIKQGDDCPFISPDGKKLFFISKRDNDRKDDREKIWVMDRNSSGLSEPKVLPNIINKMDRIHWQFSVDSWNNLYFGVCKKIEQYMAGDIYYSKYENGKYFEPEKLDTNINSPGFWQYSPFISPDGSYLIFTRQFRRNLSNLFICFRKKDNSWTRPKELKNILKIAKGVNSFVSGDGKYFFFLSGPENQFIWTPYWVDSSFIEKLRLIELKKE